MSNPANPDDTGGDAQAAAVDLDDARLADGPATSLHHFQPTQTAIQRTTLPSQSPTQPPPRQQAVRSDTRTLLYAYRPISDFPSAPPPEPSSDNSSHLSLSTQQPRSQDQDASPADTELDEA